MSKQPKNSDTTTTRARVIRKSYALTAEDLKQIGHIKDKCLNQKIVLSDSHIIRLAIKLAANLSENTLIKASKTVPQLPVGRPKKEKAIGED